MLPRSRLLDHPRNRPLRDRPGCQRQGRAGIGAELGSMKVTEQIDAIEASGVIPSSSQSIAR